MDRKIEKKPLYKRRNFQLGVGGGIIFLILIILILSDTGSKLNVEKDKITISEVKMGDFQEFIPVTGNILPKNTVFLDAVQGGAVEKKYVEEGAMLKKGDKILKLSNTAVQLNALQQEALTYQQINESRNSRLSIEQNSINLKRNVLTVQLTYQQDKRNYERDKALWDKKLTSKDNFEQSRDSYLNSIAQKKLAEENYQKDSIKSASQLKQIDESIQRLQQNLGLIRESIDNLTIRAPITGQLTALDAEIGQSKSVGERLGQVDVLDGYKVRAEIDEFYISRVNNGQEGSVEINGKDYRLVVKKVFPEVTNGRFQVDMYFKNDKAPTNLRRGQTLQIRLELGDLTKTLLLARGGFYQKTGGQWVFVVDPSGNNAVKREIKLGRQNPDYFEVLDGLKAGDKVVTSSYDTYGDIDKLVLK
ncbi:MAG: HlyD family efflux transporter periplasmic adaptor subunit [Ignavibacteriaceae bacterium]